MDPLDAQALLIRHEAALRLIEHTDQPGRIALLHEIINPSPNLLSSSLEEAERRGISTLAKAMCGHARTVKAEHARSGRQVIWARR